jgi:hypothetical protein
MPDTVRYRGTRADVRRLLARLVGALSGKGADDGTARAVQLRMGTAALSLIQQAFLIKSRGGTGSDGVKWPPLKPETIANRRPAPRKRKGERPRGLLTPAQDERWRKVYGSRLARLRAQGVAGAEALAAKIAWAVVKGEGAQTKLAVYGGRTVDMGRDSGRLFRSLAPGVEDRPSGEPEQVFQTPPGGIIVGSNVPYAWPFHMLRKLWPADLPDAWWMAILGAGLRGVEAVAVEKLQQGARA